MNARRQLPFLKEVLSDRDLRHLLIAQFVAQAADGLSQAAFAEVLVLEPGSSGTPVGILSLFALTLLPYSLIAPFMGVFVDRWPRRELLVWTNVVRGGLLVTLPAWQHLFPGDVALYIGILTLLGLGRLFLVTKGAALPVLLHEHHLLRGNALSSGAGMISALLGGVIGVGVVGIISVEVAFAFGGIAYCASSFIARRISQPLAHPHPRVEKLSVAAERVAMELRDGAVALWHRAGARIPLIGIFLLRVAGMLVAIAAILVIKREFPEAGDRFGRLSTSAVALAATGLGAFVGALCAPFIGRRTATTGLMLFGFVVSGIGILVLGGIVNIFAVVTLTFIGGFGGFLAKVSVDAQIQHALPDEFRGRAFALYDILYNLASVVAALVIVIFSDFSLRVLFLGTGTVTLLLAAALRGAIQRAGLLDAGDD